MSLSLRNQVARVYTRSDANDGGYVSTRYVTDGSLYFCRVIDLTVRERLATGQIDGATTATIELADEITVPLDGLLRVNGLVYRIKGVQRRPAKRMNQYLVEWLDQPMAETESLWNGAWILDGSRKLDGLNPTLVT